jgi:hypothetical protein
MNALAAGPAFNRALTMRGIRIPMAMLTNVLFASTVWKKGNYLPALRFAQPVASISVIWMIRTAWFQKLLKTGHGKSLLLKQVPNPNFIFSLKPN